MELAKKQHISHIPKDEALPRGVKIIAWARTIRWIGWGFGEALIPIFIFSFSSTFAEAGLFRSTYEIATLLALPIIGAWADRTSAKYLIIVALLLYPSPSPRLWRGRGQSFFKFRIVEIVPQSSNVFPDASDLTSHALRACWL